MQDAVDKTITIWIDRRRSGAAIAAYAVGAAVVVAALPAHARADDSDASSQAVVRGAETVVRLYPAAVVDGHRITLADVAELTGQTAPSAGAWAIAPAPRVGTTRSIDMAAIQRVLADRGVNLAHWRFHGASRCQVSQPALASARKTLPTTDREENDTNGGLGPAEVVRASRDVNPRSTEAVDPSTLEACLRAHITERLADLGGESVIEFSPIVRHALALSQPDYRFEITDHNERRLGLLSLEVTVYEQDRVHSTLHVLAQVSLHKKVIVAARPINRQQIIEQADLTTAERIYERADHVGLSDSAPLVGQRARRFIKTQEPIALRDVETVPLIKRNDLVTVWVRRGSIVIKAAGKAVDDASYGQTVMLKNEMSGQTFPAQVTGPRTAELITPAASAAGVQIAQRQEKP